MSRPAETPPTSPGPVVPDLTRAPARGGAFALDRVGVVRSGRTLLNQVSLSISAGSITALIGPSGAGKTTLLRLLNRLDDPSSGSVSWCDRPLGSCPIRELRRRVGFVFQTPVMFDGSVADNLRVALSLAPARPRGDDAATASATPASLDIAAVLALAGLDPGYAARSAADLSGGEKQRVALARALMTQPEVLLLDEPTAALDPEAADHLMHTLIDLNRHTRLTLIMVTHRLQEARLAATHAVMLEAGRVVESGPAAQVLDEPLQARTRDFVWAGSHEAHDAA